ncbi:diacylglycerol/lipid kinase family protein [Allorhizocola rhizosphaerae]|uniref:diacylglycerol/lipid kinase family protein n=1 Tax=Allorhizocola rhizosphaerae TaxID=1872709 RepID=UPI000E3E21A2|nr:diacylglycerol kinase family protein [Allorhizocola rhizosphaerae]
MRGLLVVNPKATTTSARTRDVLTSALRNEMELTVGYTRRRGHGYDLAKDAASDSIDVVVALGGDGTVNEVVNGLMAGTDEKRPALAVVPGGSTNVFVRALGLPRQPVEAAGVILAALRSGSSRMIGLGRADERYFTFCAGMGIDAAVVRRVERARRRGRRSTPILYLRSALGEYFFDAIRHDPGITLSLPDEPEEIPVANVIVQNTAPWTYLGDRPVHASPEASFDSGLDVLALRVLRPPSTLQTVGRMLSLQRDHYGKRVMLRHDLDEFTVSCATPQAFQLDGDYLGEREKVKFASVPAAIRVIC